MGRGDLGLSLGAQEAAPEAAKELSRHERQLERTRARVAELEAQNVGAKDWYLRGEVQAGAAWASVQDLGTPGM